MKQLLSRLRNHPTVPHDFDRWQLARRTMTTRIWGETMDEVQERRCKHCGFIQRAEVEIEKQKDVPVCDKGTGATM
jgi:hypothetical protein